MVGPSLVLTLPEALLPSPGAPHPSTRTHVPNRPSTRVVVQPPPHTQPKYGKKEPPTNASCQPSAPSWGLHGLSLVLRVPLGPGNFWVF